MNTGFLSNWLRIAAALFLASNASALNFEIPKDLQEEAEAQKAKEAARQQEAVEALYEGKAEADEDAAMTFGSDESDAEMTAENASSEDALDEASFLEFDPNSPTGTALGDNGMITGQIFDKESSQPLSGVAILIEGTDIGSITDGNGNYTLGPIEAGTYTLNFLKTGYIEANVTEFEVVAGESKEFGFALPPRPAEMSDEVFELQDFVVSAEEANDMMMKLDIRMDSDAILNVLSGEDFSKYAASDVGEAIKRVSGVTVQGGQFAVIRGLEERYTSTTFNGAPIPSPDPDKQSVPLDLFSSDVVSNLTISKTFEPQLPGNSAGGSIGIWTNVYPEELTIKVSGKTGFNDNAQDDFISPGRNDTYVNYSQAQDEAAPDFSGDPSYNTPDAEIADIRGKRVTPRERDAKMDYSFGLEVGGTKEFGNGREVRGLATISSKKEYRTAKGTKEKRAAAPAFNVNSRGNYSDVRYLDDGTVSPPRRADTVSSDTVLGTLTYSSGLYDQIISKEEDELNILLSGEVDLDTEGEQVIGATYFYTDKEQDFANDLFNGMFTDTQALTDAEVSNSRGYVPTYTPISTQFLADASEDTGFSQSEILNDSRYQTSTLALVERSLEVYQVHGRHQVGDTGLKLGWNYSDSTAEQTDSDVISLTSLTLPDGTIYANIGTDSGDQFTPFASYRKIEEDQEFARVDANYDWEVADELTVALSAGLSAEDTERESTLITYNLRTNGADAYSTDREGTFQDILNGDAFVSPAPVGSAISEREIDSYYFSSKITYKKWDLVGGIRFEDFLMSTENVSGLEFFNADVLVNPDGQQLLFPVFNSQFLGVNGGEPLTEDFDSKIDENHYLPMASVSFRPIEGMRATFAYSETNARPSFKDFTYISSRDPESLDYFIGNPALKTSDVTSYDFRIEYAWNNGDLVSFGLFYKTVEDPIEKTSVRGSDAVTEIMYNNPDDAVIQGLEFEVRKNLGFIDENFLQYFTVGGNFTLIEGSIDILPAMQDIFEGGFTYTTFTGGEATAGEGHDVESGDTTDSGNPERRKAPYTDRELFQQPEWIVNADISFDHPEWGTRATLSFFTQSDVLVTAEGFLFEDNFVTPSRYLESYHEVNFTFSQDLGFWLDGLQVSFQVKNLTDSERSVVYGDDFGGGTESNFKLGRNYSFGLSYVF